MIFHEKNTKIHGKHDDINKGVPVKHQELPGKYAGNTGNQCIYRKLDKIRG